MVWEVRESGHGGVVASYGMRHPGGVEIGCKPGVTMPAFIEYFSMRFDTRKQAERYIAKTPNPLKGR